MELEKAIEKLETYTLALKNCYTPIPDEFFKALEVVLALAHTVLSCEGALPSKVKFWDNMSPELRKLHECHNKTIDACATHLAKRLEGVEKFLKGYLRELKIDCNSNDNFWYLDGHIEIDNFAQAIRNLSLGGEEK